MKGYFKADEGAVAWGLFGGLTALVVSDKFKKGGACGKCAAGGALLGLAARAMFDDKLKVERSA